MLVHPEPRDGGVDFAPRCRADLSVRAEALTWQHALFAVEAGGRTVYLLRDQRDAGAFLDAFDAGLLDTELRALLAQPPRKRLTRRRARRSSP